MSMKKPVGFLLIVVGLLTLFFVTPIAVLSSFATWVLIWFVVSTIAVGSLLMGGLGLKTSLKSLLVALAFLLPLSLIFFILLRAPAPPIPLAVLVALIGVLFYLYWHKRKAQ